MTALASTSRWISIDGLDFAGKSVLVDHLVRQLEATIIPEFSSSPLGQHLEGQVARNPHFIEHSPIGQSLMFLADHADLATRANNLRSAGHLVIQDRGLLSKFVYQVLVLRGTIGDPRARSLVSAVLRDLPRPDAAVFLDIDVTTLRRRHLAARGRQLEPAHEKFLSEAMDLFREEAASGSVLQSADMVHIVPDSDEDQRSVAERVLAGLGLGRS